MKKVGKALYTLIMSIILIVILAFGLGFIMQLLLNPIFAYLGFKAVTTKVCMCSILMWFVIKLLP